MNYIDPFYKEEKWHFVEYKYSHDPIDYGIRCDSFNNITDQLDFVKSLKRSSIAMNIRWYSKTIEVPTKFLKEFREIGEKH